MKMILNKLKGKICSTLAKYPVTFKWPTFWWKQCGYSIGKGTIIGPEVLIWAWHHLDTSNVIIEDDVSIGPRVMIIARSHLTSQIEIDGKVTSSIPGKIIIKKGAWIGAGAIILPDVMIGEFSVVGAGAVVTRDVPPHSIVIGVPAKVIKKLKVKNETST